MGGLVAPFVFFAVSRQLCLIGVSFRECVFIVLCVVENNVIDAIHALEEMEDYDVSDEVMLPQVNYLTMTTVLHGITTVMEGCL